MSTKRELVYSILDIFEDFLEERGVNIQNDEKLERISEGDDPNTLCVIYGRDYGFLQDRIMDAVNSASN